MLGDPSGCRHLALSHPGVNGQGQGQGYIDWRDECRIC